MAKRKTAKRRSSRLLLARSHRLVLAPGRGDCTGCSSTDAAPVSAAEQARDVALVDGYLTALDGVHGGNNPDSTVVPVQ
jgi:hypothetical protein